MSNYKPSFEEGHSMNILTDELKRLTLHLLNHQEATIKYLTVGIFLICINDTMLLLQSHLLNML